MEKKEWYIFDDGWCGLCRADRCQAKDGVQTFAIHGKPVTKDEWEAWAGKPDANGHYQRVETRAFPRGSRSYF